MNISLLQSEWRHRLNHRRRAPRPRWLRVAAWIWVGFTAFTLFVAVMLLILYNNPRFHRYLIRTVEAEASKSLGVRVHLQNFALHFPTLSADLYGITVEGASPYPDPPLLQVDHIEAGVRVSSILHKAWYFDSIRIDRPIAHVYVDDHGVSNIPTIKSSNSSSNTSIFDLGIRHALLDRGEVYYNDRPTNLAVDLRDLGFKASFNSSLQTYSGKLTYSDGRLVYGTFQPLAHNLEAQFSASPTTFDLTESKLTVGVSQLALSASLHNYSNPNLQANYDVTVDGGQVATLLHNPSVPTGTIHTSGSIQYQENANRSMIQSLQVSGELASRRLGMKTPAVHAEIADLAGQYSLANGDATLRGLRANLLGGQLAGQGTMKNVGGNSHANLSAAVHGVSLSDVAQALGTAASDLNVSESGKLNADFTASWGKTLDDLVAHTDATMNGQVSRGHAAHARVVSANSSRSGGGDATRSPTAIPVESAIHATYTARTQQLAMDKSYLHTPQTNLTMDGIVSKRSHLNLRLQAGDLRELETIADLFRPSSPDHAPQPLGLAGRASFQGKVQGSTAAPHLMGQLTASNLQISGTAWKSVQTNVDVSPSMASLQHANLEPATRGRIAFSASTGLTKWSFINTSPIQIELEASQLEIADFTKFANQPIPITGTLNAGLRLHGTELSPVGNGNISLTNVTAYEQPVHAAKLTFAGDATAVNGDLSMQLPAGSIQGKANVHPREKTYIAELTANGIQLDKLQAVKARALDLKGTLALDAKGRGSFDNPQLDATIQIPTLAVQSQTVTGIKLQMNVADHVGNAALVSSAVNTSIQAKAKIDLTGDYPADASLDTQSIPLQPLLAIYAPDQAADVTGQTEVHATLHGPLKRKDQLEAHVSIPVFKVAYGNSIQLAAASPIRADYKNGIVDIQRSSIQGTDTDLQFQGSIPATGNGPMSLLLEGTVNLQLAQLFDPDVRTSGQLRFNIDSHGPANGSDLGGQIEIVDANFASPDLPVGLQHGNGVLKMTKDRINISSFQATVGGGTLTAQGGMAYRPAIQFDMGLAAKNIRILYPQGMRENVDANLRLAGSTDDALLGGSVNLSDLSFTQAFDLNNFVGQFSDSVASPPTQGLAQNMRLDIAVHSTNNVNLVSRTLSIGGTANLQVRGTAAEPVILGRVNLNNGDIILNGNRFVLNGGTIQFVNPSETQPVVNLTLNTNIQQYSIDLRFKGPVDQLRTEYSSDPALPSADIINLLAFGETTEASAQNATPTNQAAESLVASQVSSQVTSRVSKIAGISQLSISPVLAGSSSQGPPGAVITIQQRVTGNLFVNFSTNVASTQSQTIQGQYRVSPRVSLSATRDPNGGFAFDTLIKKSW
jgi:translocation and assembly module TamB